MYSQHDLHLLSSSGASQHHRDRTYGSNTGSAIASSHYTSSTDTGLAPQSSFDNAPGSQHPSSLHQSPNDGNGSWGQGMHYSNIANCTKYESNASYGAYGSSNHYGSAEIQAPSGGVAGSNAAGSVDYYGMQTANGDVQPDVQPHSGYGNNALAGGLNGSTGDSSAHHSGTSMPTSQIPYHYQHPHTLGSVFPSHHHQSVYYGTNGSVSSNNIVSFLPLYTSAAQHSTQVPFSRHHHVATFIWEDEGTLCFQVHARGVCVARRHDNNMINGTKLLNVCGMSRGKRDGILKNEKERIVVKDGAMHLKGVWVTLQRGKQLAEQNNILDVLYPLFEHNFQSFLYHPDNYPHTAAVVASAQERYAKRSRAFLGLDSPAGYQRASSQATNGFFSHDQANPTPLMRSSSTPNAPLAPGAFIRSHQWT